MRSINLGVVAVARSLGISPRTLQRILAADALGTPAPMQRSALMARLCEALALRQRPTAYRRYGRRSVSPSSAPRPVSECSLAPVSAHSGVGGVVQGDRGLGPTPPSVAHKTPKEVYVVDIKEKKGKGPRRVVRLRHESWGPKGGRPKHSKKMHPVVEEMVYNEED
jgi:hypothetical protein